MEAVGELSLVKRVDKTWIINHQKKFSSTSESKKKSSRSKPLFSIRFQYTVLTVTKLT